MQLKRGQPGNQEYARHVWPGCFRGSTDREEAERDEAIRVAKLLDAARAANDGLGLVKPRERSLRDSIRPAHQVTPTTKLLNIAKRARRRPHPLFKDTDETRCFHSHKEIFDYDPEYAQW